MSNYFEKIYKYNGITFRYAKGKSLRFGNEIHNYHEILYYIDGDAFFMSENIKEKLNKESLIIVPKECYHNFNVRDQENYTRLVISFYGLNEFEELQNLLSQKIQIITDIKGNLLNTLNRMTSIINDERSDNNKSVYLYGAFLTLVADIIYGMSKEFLTLNSKQNNYILIRCIHYINTHLSENITIENLSKTIGVSQSTIFQLFLKELGISPHKYITEKRLILARRKIIEEKQNPTSVYLDCGYNDYPSFYKAYVKMFKHSPANDKKNI